MARSKRLRAKLMLRALSSWRSASLPTDYVCKLTISVYLIYEELAYISISSEVYIPKDPATLGLPPKPSQRRIVIYIVSIQPYPPLSA